MPRLRRSDTAGPGYRRQRSGKGFTYRDPDGNTLHDAELRERFERLAIPPAWQEVWLCPYANGHVQATGIDDAGRRQYLYHPSWRSRMDKIKYDRALALGEVLPPARRQVTMDLRRDDLSKERALGAAFRMLDVANLRVGSEQYALKHGSFGLSTLLCAHASVVGGSEVQLKFPAKSGQEWSSEVRDPDLAAFVSRLKRRGGRARLLAWRDQRGWHPLSSAEINEYVRAKTGEDFTAKDFRTLQPPRNSRGSGPWRRRRRAAAPSPPRCAPPRPNWGTPRPSHARPTWTRASWTATTRAAPSTRTGSARLRPRCACCCSDERGP